MRIEQCEWRSCGFSAEIVRMCQQLEAGVAWMGPPADAPEVIKFDRCHAINWDDNRDRDRCEGEELTAVLSAGDSFYILRGSCDYTGWDCQAEIRIEPAGDDLEQAWRLLTDDERNRWSR